jgi:hypothetical protein
MPCGLITLPPAAYLAGICLTLGAVASAPTGAFRGAGARVASGGNCVLWTGAAVCGGATGALETTGGGAPCGCGEVSGAVEAGPVG